MKVLVGDEEEAIVFNAYEKAFRAQELFLLKLNVMLIQCT